MNVRPREEMCRIGASLGSTLSHKLRKKDRVDVDNSAVVSVMNRAV